MFTHKQLTVLLACVQYAHDQFFESACEINPTDLNPFEYGDTLGDIQKKLKYLLCFDEDCKTILIEELDKLLRDWEDFMCNFPSDMDVANKRITVLQTLKNYILYH